MKRLFTYIVIVLNLGVVLGQSVEIIDPNFRQCLMDDYSDLLDDSNRLVLQRAHDREDGMSCSNKGISQVPEFGYFVNLRSLSLHTNDISDVSWLSQLTNLEEIYMSTNHVADVPDLSGLTKMHSFWMGHNELTALPELNPGIERMNISGNEITQMDLSLYPNLNTIYTGPNPLTSLDAVGALTQLKILHVSQTAITNLPSLELCDSLEQINATHSSLVALEGLETTPNLKEIHVQHSNIESLGWIDTTSLEVINVDSNRLTFEDILPYKNWSRFDPYFQNYTIQQPQGDSLTLLKGVGASWSWELDFDQNVDSNYYIWYKDDVQVDSTRNGVFEISSLAPDDAGTYYCRVGNLELPDLTIDVLPVVLEVYGVQANQPYAFSPDGDGDEDELFIEQSGVAKIYDETGNLVRELEVPALWDGQDMNNLPLDLGYYVIIFEDGGSFGVTLVR